MPALENPLIIQSDYTVLVEVHSPRYEEARDALARFAELVKSPEHVHTYRITPLSIWNACAAGMSAGEIVQTLHGLAKYDVPHHIETEIGEYAARFGKLQLVRDEKHGLRLILSDRLLAEELSRQKEVPKLTSVCRCRKNCGWITPSLPNGTSSVWLRRTPPS